MRLIKFTLFLSIALIFLGCSGDEDETFRDDLTGSCWHQDIDEYISYTYYFGINKECTIEWKTGITKPVSTHHKYEYKHPNITITGGRTGYIEGNTMYLETDTRTLELTKVR